VGPCRALARGHAVEYSTTAEQRARGVSATGALAPPKLNGGTQFCSKRSVLAVLRICWAKRLIDLMREALCTNRFRSGSGRNRK
jgi:hypothetical protein